MPASMPENLKLLCLKLISMGNKKKRKKKKAHKYINFVSQSLRILNLYHLNKIFLHFLLEGKILKLFSFSMRIKPDVPAKAIYQFV